MSPKTSEKKNQPADPVKIGMLSLGCPKTLVDSENILGKLTSRRYALVPSVTDCDIALLNTCSFIQEAQEESLEKIFELIELKKEGLIKAVVVIGCLVQKFPKDLQKELGEVDAFIGSGEYARIPEIIENVVGGQKEFIVGKPGYLATSSEARISLTPAHYRYIKISEGCDHICSFCTIPMFRGKHRSRGIEDIVIEANHLVRAGAKEIILTGQDTTYYGRDFNGEFLLPELLRSVGRTEGLKWLRLLYAYPSCITEDLMRAMLETESVCHYLDMPLQHASDRMLTAMRRGITKRRTYDLIRQFRQIIPDLAIRTTFIVGFPGETEQDFTELLEFMSDMRFERLGIFTYSQEADSPSASLPDQVADELKKERLERAMLHQQEISRKNNERFLGQTLEVLIEEFDADSGVWIGRSYMDAPEVDGNVFVKTHQKLEAGCFYPVQIESTQEYDLLGRI